MILDVPSKELDVTSCEFWQSIVAALNDDSECRLTVYRILRLLCAGNAVCQQRAM